LIKENADAATYILPAQGLLSRGAFLDVFGRPEISRTPGYPAFLAVLMQLFGQDPRRLLLAQAVVLSFEVLVLYSLAVRILAPVPAFFAALLAAFSPWGAVLAGFL
jgi:hypothetical protein